MTTPAHTDAVEIAQACIAEMRLRVVIGRLVPDSVIAALIEPKLRERDGRIKQLENLLVNAQAINQRDGQYSCGKESELRAQIAAAREDGELLDFVERLDATIESDGGCGDGPSIWTCSWGTGNVNDRQLNSTQAESVRSAIRAARQTHEEGKG